MSPPREEPYPLGVVLCAACDVCDMPISKLRERLEYPAVGRLATRHKPTVTAIHLFAVVAKELGYSYPVIGRHVSRGHAAMVQAVHGWQEKQHEPAPIRGGEVTRLHLVARCLSRVRELCGGGE